MITIKKVDNILSGTDFTFALKQVNEKERSALGTFNGISYAIYDQSNHLFPRILKDMMMALLQEHKIYLIYIESNPQPTTKIRSHKKMFDVNVQKQIKPNNIFEYEHQLGNGKSLKTGMVRMTEANCEYCIDHLLNSNFAFGYIVPTTKRSFKNNRQAFLKDVAFFNLDGLKTVRVNLPKIIASCLGPNQEVFTILTTGKDEEIIRFYHKKEGHEDFSGLLNAVAARYRYMEN